jgi:hypothetical protein
VTNLADRLREVAECLPRAASLTLLVSVFTVSRELGDGSEAAVQLIHGHLGTVRHRAKGAEYRVEQHWGMLKAQLAAVRLGAGKH